MVEDVTDAVTDAQIINPIPADEAAGWCSTLATTFFGDPQEEQFPRFVQAIRTRWEPTRTCGARSGAGRWVATLATQERTVTVPGPDGGTHDLTADALTGVTVNATHRRRGLLTRMLRASLAAAAERGDAVSILIAAEWPIYPRFGYAPASIGAEYSYFPRHPNGKLAPSGRGGVRQIDPAEAGKLGPVVFDAARRLRPGQVGRPTDWWWSEHLNLDEDTAVREGKAPNLVLRENADGEPDGLVAWRATRDFDMIGNLAALEVTDLLTAGEDAYRDLWAYLSGIDAVGEITLRHRPVDEPVRWLLADGRALRQTYAGDYLWLRLLDVPAALSARSYAVPGRLVVEVDDDPLGYANGRFALEVDGDVAGCAVTSDAPELRISHRTLASAYLGGHRLRALTPTGGIDELVPGALERADVMFAVPLAPCNATSF
jgi:predicted acetyltransferase